MSDKEFYTLWKYIVFCFTLTAVVAMLCFTYRYRLTAIVVSESADPIGTRCSLDNDSRDSVCVIYATKVNVQRISMQQ